MISISDLSFGYDEETILENISVDIKAGQITSILGANGCGKSTLLSIISKNIENYSGIVSLEGKDIKSIGLKSFAQKVAVVHQKQNAPDDITVEQLVSYGRLPYRSILKVGLDEEGKKHVNKALKLTELENLRYRKIGTLSGGQRQRVYIAMALAQDAKVLLLDEPTTFLDVRYQVEIMRLIKKLNKQNGITILMVIHDINQAITYSDNIIGIAGKKILFEGSPDAVISKESIYNLYNIDLPVFNQEGQVCVLTI